MRSSLCLNPGIPTQEVHIMNGGDQATPASGSQAVDRALALLQITGRAAGRGASLSELIEASGLGSRLWI